MLGVCIPEAVVPDAVGPKRIAAKRVYAGEGWEGLPAQQIMYNVVIKNQVKLGATGVVNTLLSKSRSAGSPHGGISTGWCYSGKRYKRCVRSPRAAVCIRRDGWGLQNQHNLSLRSPLGHPVPKR